MRTSLTVRRFLIPSSLSKQSNLSYNPFKTENIFTLHSTTGYQNCNLF